MQSWLNGKSVLILGASGTIGSALLRSVLEANPEVVRAFDNYENGLFHLQQEVNDDERVRWLLGDIRDLQRVRRASEGIDIILHTAALKHVGIGEYNPFELVQTNLLGLQNVIQASLENNVEKMIFTSSDKAVNPTNAMGASKLMGEKLVTAAQSIRGQSKTIFASVRFGNVIGSNGSVVPIFEKQIKSGGPLTITDKRMTRFVMGIEHSVDIVLKAAELSVGGEVFVLKMPALSVSDLADVMINRLAPQYGHSPKEIKITEIGARIGEKMYEELLSLSEIEYSFQDDELIVSLAQSLMSQNIDRPYLANMTPTTSEYNSHQSELMTKPEIENFLESLNVLPSSESKSLVAFEVKK